MDLNQLREAFSLSETYVERIRNFRTKRVDALNTPDHDLTPVSLENGPYLLLHSIPLNFSEHEVSVDLAAIYRERFLKWDVSGYINFARYNIDGLVRPYGLETPEARLTGYLQLFRHGCMEVVMKCGQAFDSSISLPDLERISLHYIDEVLSAQASLGVEPPVIIAISLCRIKGQKFLADYDRFSPMGIPTRPRQITQDRVLLSETAIFSYSDDPKLFLKPIFDVMWNIGGCGWSLSYDTHGQWIGK